METTILIRPEDLTRNTIINGSVDIDRYLQSIKACQNIYIKPILGKTLYDKLCLDFENDELNGDYLEMYSDFIQGMVIHGAAEIYLSQGAYMVSNSGITKTKTDSSETISKEEVDYLVESSRRLYNLYESEFLKWIKNKDIVEYNKPCNIVNKKYGGWRLNKRR